MVLCSLCFVLRLDVFLSVLKILIKGGVCFCFPLVVFVFLR